MWLNRCCSANGSQDFHSSLPSLLVLPFQLHSNIPWKAQWLYHILWLCAHMSTHLSIQLSSGTQNIGSSLGSWEGSPEKKLEGLRVALPVPPNPLHCCTLHRERGREQSLLIWETLYHVWRHKPLLLSMWPGVPFLVWFNNFEWAMSFYWKLHTYSSHPFLCALAIYG